MLALPDYNVALKPLNGKLATPKLVGSYASLTAKAVAIAGNYAYVAGHDVHNTGLVVLR